ISADGRFVAFQSRPMGELAGDPGGACGIFVRDRATGETTLASVSAEGIPADEDAIQASISADGRFVAFTSRAAHLSPAPVNGSPQLCAHARAFSTGGAAPACSPTTELASVDAMGRAGDGDSGTPALSGDGRFVAFTSNAGNLEANSPSCATDFYFTSANCYDAFVHENGQTGPPVRVSETADGAGGDSSSGVPVLSGDGRFVAFATLSANLVPGQLSSNRGFLANTLVRDRDADGNGVFDEPTPGAVKTTVVSNGPRNDLGDQSSIDPAISADGRFVAFSSGS